MGWVRNASIQSSPVHVVDVEQIFRPVDEIRVHTPTQIVTKLGLSMCLTSHGIPFKSFPRWRFAL